MVVLAGVVNVDHVGMTASCVIAYGNRFDSASGLVAFLKVDHHRGRNRAAARIDHARVA